MFKKEKTNYLNLSVIRNILEYRNYKVIFNLNWSILITFVVIHLTHRLKQSDCWLYLSLRILPSKLVLFHIAFNAGFCEGFSVIPLSVFESYAIFLVYQSNVNDLDSFSSMFKEIFLLDCQSIALSKHRLT